MSSRNRFRVTGSGAFPFSMLHRDQCFPSSSVDADLMPDTFLRRSVALVSSLTSAPNVKAWARLGWTVEVLK